MSQNSGPSIFGGILLDLTRTLAAAGMAYVAWKMHSPDWFYFGALAWICALAGAWRFCLALYGICKLIAGALPWRRFRRRGVTPKADPVASTDELRRRGLTK